jgi:hypothetical protein
LNSFFNLSSTAGWYRRERQARASCAWEAPEASVVFGSPPGPRGREPRRRSGGHGRDGACEHRDDTADLRGRPA